MRRRLRRRPVSRKALTPKTAIGKAPGSDDSGALRLVLLPHGSAWFCVLPLGKVGIVLVPTGDPPSLRFGHPDVTFGRYRLSSLGVAGYRAGAAAFSGCALRVSARTLSDAERGEGGASG